MSVTCGVYDRDLQCFLPSGMQNPLYDRINTPRVIKEPTDEGENTHLAFAFLSQDMPFLSPFSLAVLLLAEWFFAPKVSLSLWVSRVFSLSYSLPMPWHL